MNHKQLDEIREMSEQLQRRLLWVGEWTSRSMTPPQALEYSEWCDEGVPDYLAWVETLRRRRRTDIVMWVLCESELRRHHKLSGVGGG